MISYRLVIVIHVLQHSLYGFSLSTAEGINNFRVHKTYNDLMAEVDEVTNSFPNVTMKELIGQSTKKKNIYAVKIGWNVKKGRPLLRPMVKFVANMHGDEAMGLEMMVVFIRYLTSNYGVDERVTKIVNNVELSIVPTMNPDSLGIQRGNANGVDLNRVFPTWKDLGKSLDQLQEGREVEVKGMIEWIMKNPFVLSVNFHDGAVVANYPWDDEDVEPWTKSDMFIEGDKDKTPDDELFRQLGLTYAENHKTMQKECICNNDHFHYGITKGTDWYAVTGGMQDFNYLFSNCMEITAELICGKKFSKASLKTEWENNKESLLKFTELSYSAVRGIVIDREGNPAANATIRVDWLGKHVVTTDRGEYWRLLSPGKYVIKAVSQDKMFQSENKSVLINSRTNHGTLLQLDFLLDIPRDSKQDDEPEGFQFKFGGTVLRNPVKNITIPRVCLTLSLVDGFQWC